MTKDEVELQQRFYTLSDHDYFGGPANKWAAQLQAGNVYILEQCQLPSLYRQRNENSGTEYRLVVLPGGHDRRSPFCVRLLAVDDVGWISAHWFGAYSEQGLLAPVVSVTNQISGQHSEDIRRQLTESGFWTMPQIDTDGPEAFHDWYYSFEALQDGRYHCVIRGVSAFESARAYLEFCVRFADHSPVALHE